MFRETKDTIEPYLILYPLEVVQYNYTKQVQHDIVFADFKLPAM